MKTIGILQPSYMPWLGFFDQIQQCDVFVIYDDVQFDKNGWRNRNKIKTANGVHWLTVPVYHRGLSNQLIYAVKINNTEKWKSKHIRSLEQNYAKAQFFKQHSKCIFDIIQNSTDFLLDLNMKLIQYFMLALGITTTLVYSSTLNIFGEPVERLIDIVKHLGGARFLEGSSGRNYIVAKQFFDSGIDLLYHDYKHPVYAQLYGEFIPYMSIIDILFNCGQHSLEILRSK